MTAETRPANSSRVTFHASLAPLARQFTSFFWIGLIAAVIHYGCLIGLVELAGFSPLAATLIGFVGGGIASYALNRRYTYRSVRPHVQATWRFAVVAFIGFLLTWGLMSFFGWLAGPRFALLYVYLLAQLATTGIVLVWSFLAHKFWSFGETTSPLVGEAESPPGLAFGKPEDRLSDGVRGKSRPPGAER